MTGFTKDELVYIKGRMELELRWGPNVYDPADRAIMNDIITKCDEAIKSMEEQHAK